MRILLSASTKHFNPEGSEIILKHSVGVLTKLFYDTLSEFGEVKLVSDVDKTEGEEFDLICSWPRNFWWLTTRNKHKKNICFLNIAEPGYLSNVLREESNRLGCKLSDCFMPQRFKNADLYFLIGNNEVVNQYIRAGYPDKIVRVSYRHNEIPFKARDKNKKTVFLHLGTTLGLRKGFWHVVNDFKNADIDAELWCVGQVQKENWWVDFAKEAEKDERIKILGWVESSSDEYKNIIHSADFMVFPSFGEGQPGTIIETMEGGCIPLLTKESGISYYPLGEYIRGNSEIYKKAHEMSNEKFRELQLEGQEVLNSQYDNEVFKETIRREIKKLME